METDANSHRGGAQTTGTRAPGAKNCLLCIEEKTSLTFKCEDPLCYGCRNGCGHGTAILEEGHADTQICPHLLILASGKFRCACCSKQGRWRDAKRHVKVCYSISPPPSSVNLDQAAPVAADEGLNLLLELAAAARSGAPGEVEQSCGVGSCDKAIAAKRPREHTNKEHIDLNELKAHVPQKLILSSSKESHVKRISIDGPPPSMRGVMPTEKKNGQQKSNSSLVMAE